VQSNARLIGRFAVYERNMLPAYAPVFLVAIIVLLLFFPLSAGAASPLADLTFNEVLSRPELDWDHDGLPPGPTDAYVELYNAGLSSFPLNQVALDSGPGSYQIDFPLWATVPPHGVFVVFGRQYPQLKLWPDGGEVRLLPILGGAPITVLHYPALGVDQAYSRAATGNWTTVDPPSPGALNPSEVPSPSGKGSSNNSLSIGPTAATSIAAVRRSMAGQWVTITGQVTAPLGTVGASRLFVQDGSGGIAVTVSGRVPPPVMVGDWIAARGIFEMSQGEAELLISAAGSLQWGGEGLPPPPVPLAPTAAPLHDDQLVSIGGTIRAIGHQMFAIAAPGTQRAWCAIHWVDVDGAHDWQIPPAGMPVTLTGILEHSRWGSALPWTLWLRSPLDLQGPPASALWGMPLAMARHVAPGTVVTVVAQVTVPPGILDDHTLYIADEGGGLRVQLPQAGTLWPGVGEWLALSGIIRRAVNEPELILTPDVPARILGLGPAPQPVQLALLAALPQYEARLVQVTGQVVSSASGTWLMAADRAQVAVRTSPVIMATLSRLSRSPVTLVGVVVSTPTGLVLLPRDPHDILAPVSSPQATAGAVAQVWSVVHVLASSDVWWVALLLALLVSAGVAYWLLPRLVL
jgi:hypothetical protein